MGLAGRIPVKTDCQRRSQAENRFGQPSGINQPQRQLPHLQLRVLERKNSRIVALSFQTVPRKEGTPGPKPGCTFQITAVGRTERVDPAAAAAAQPLHEQTNVFRAGTHERTQAVTAHVVKQHHGPTAQFTQPVQQPVRSPAGRKLNQNHIEIPAQHLGDHRIRIRRVSYEATLSPQFRRHIPDGTHPFGKAPERRNHADQRMFRHRLIDHNLAV